MVDFAVVLCFFGGIGECRPAGYIVNLHYFFAVRNQKVGVENQEIYDLKFVINKQQSAGMTDGLL